ncbi:MAG: S41 family peptidase [Tenuifilaceae bacterium]|jgi:carboxyl-terminal processing protease|nr:S41 family peptidase [Tenuifilaceae bacterium]
MIKTGKIFKGFAIGFSAAILMVGLISFKSVDFKLSKSLDIFFSFFREVNIFYVDKPNPEKLISVGIEAMLESLDPYNEYIPEENMETLEFQTTGEYGGMGALIRHGNDYPVIAEIYEGSPAHKAGLMNGDKILEINGRSVFSTPVDQVSGMLKGVPNTELNVVIRRLQNPDSLSFKFKRSKIHIPSVPYFGIISEGIGYIKLSNFTTNCHKEVESALKELKSKHKANRLVLDLRGNPGGLLNEAVKIVNLFVKKDELVVYTKGQIKDFDQEYKTASRPVDSEIPLIILVDRISASASEIVAGALQDLDRAIIVGERTFGKGLVQATRPLPYNSQLKITTAKYYIPSGRCIQAVDFSQRAEDGSLSYIPDSLISDFKTRNGRLVRDGGGITPDIDQSLKMYSRLASVLYAQNKLFDFATQFRITNPTIVTPAQFSLTDNQYDEFVMYLSKSGFTYQSQSEFALNELVKIAQQEKYYDLLKHLSDSLKIILTGNGKMEYELFKPEIKRLLEEEIIGRYYFQRGKSEYSIKNDSAVWRSIELHSNPNEFNAILTGTNSALSTNKIMERKGFAAKNNGESIQLLSSDKSTKQFRLLPV